MDSYSVLRDGSAALTADATLTTFKVGPMDHPLWLHVYVPAFVGGSTLDIELEFCKEASSTTQEYNMFMKQIAAVGFYSIPFYTKLEYVQVKLDVTGAGADFGGVKIWIDPANRSNKAN